MKSKSWNRHSGKGLSVLYEEKLARMIKNPDGYLWFDDSASLSALDGMANDAYDKGTIEGYFTSAIISHQLVERLLLLLAKYSDLLIQASIYPAELDSEFKNLNTLGKLIIRHKSTVVFSKKAEIIQNARTINDLRNRLVHDIDQHGNEDVIQDSSKQIRDDFEIIFRDWDEAMKWFYFQLNELKARSALKELLSKYSLE